MPGDKVSVLHGAVMPVLLRPQGDGTYSVVGNVTTKVSLMGSLIGQG
jgi:hypothetical protein